VTSICKCKMFYNLGHLGTDLFCVLVGIRRRYAGVGDGGGGDGGRRRHGDGAGGVGVARGGLPLLLRGP
jgi:hypothetical protein